MTALPRRIDHLVLAVHDLDTSAAFYRRLGFHVGIRNRHPWGTENQLIQLGTSFLELITVADATIIPPHRPRMFSFGAFVRDYLEEREGLAMLALSSADATADAVDFAREGIGDYDPFSFERDGRQPDGSVVRVGFTLAFARNPFVRNAMFFVCQHHAPHAFWNPVYQQHRNGAKDVAAVRLAATDMTGQDDFLTRFTGVAPVFEPDRSFVLRNGQRLELESGLGADGFSSFTVRVADLELVRGHLLAEGVPFRSDPDCLVIADELALGVTVRFEQEQA